MKDFGVQATVVYPGYFRTDFLTTGSLGTPQQPIAAYQAIRDSLALHQNQINGNQPGDPEKAAAALIQLSEAETQPLHLFLGADAYQMADVKMAAVQHDLRQWQGVGTATGFAVPNLFAINNGVVKNALYSSSRYQVNSLYGRAQLDYKRFVFLEGTARNDWDSSLPSDSRSYFYYSGSAALGYTDLLKLDSKVLARSPGPGGRSWGS
jgi:hypothetical protein